MKGKEYLTKPEQFALVYNRGRSLADPLLVMKMYQNQLDHSRYGISVSKRVGNAVRRNRVKRRLREILRFTPLCPGWDIVVIARSPSAESDFNLLQRSVNNLFSRAHIVAK